MCVTAPTRSTVIAKDDTVDLSQRFIALGFRRFLGSGDALHDQGGRRPDVLRQEARRTCPPG
jgi:hypothetical protein